MWLYIPPDHLSTSSPCAQASEDLNSESTLHSTLLAKLDGVWFTWRGKPQQPQAWLRRWKQGGFIRRLSGLTCEPSTLDHGAASFISSLRAIPARTTAWPESAPEPMESDSSRPRSAALPRSAGLILSSAKTCRGTRTDSLKPLSQHWKGWATALRQEYSVRPKPATPCGASDCSSWPSARAEDAESSGRREARGTSDTLTAAARDAVENWPSPMAGAAGTEDYNAAGNSDFSRKAMEQTEALLTWAAPQARDHFPPHSPERIAAMKAQGHGMRNLNDEAAAWRSPSDISKRGGSQPVEKRQEGGHTVNLEDQAEHWQAPTVGMVDGSNKTRSKARSDELLLTGQAEQTSAKWAAPVAMNHKGSSQGSITRQDGKSRMDLLHYQAEQQFDPQPFLPPSSPAPAIPAGEMSSIASPNTSPPSLKRKLNPIFVEALMRWPTGLSGFERQETALIRWRLLMPSYLSDLVSACGEPEQMPMAWE